MKKIIKSIKTFPLLWAFLFILIILIPKALVLPAESDRYAIVNAIAIDKADDEIELSVILHVPMSTTLYEEIYNTVSAKGKTISQAIELVQLQIGKELGMQHTSIIAIGKEFAKTDIMDHLTIMLHEAKIGNSTQLVYCEEKAKDLLDTAVKVNKSLGLKLSEILKYNDSHALSQTTNLEEFFRGYLSISKSHYLPVVRIDENGNGLSAEDPGGKENEGSSDGNKSSGENKKKCLLNTGEVALFKDGRCVDILSTTDVKALNYLNKKINYGSITIDNFSNGGVEYDSISFDIKSKNQITSVEYKNGFPSITYTIFFNLVASEILVKNKDDDFSLLSGYEGDYLTKKIHEKVNSEVENAFGIMKKNNVDCLEIYNLLERKDEKKFTKFLQIVGVENYLDFVSIEIKTNVKVKN